MMHRTLVGWLKRFASLVLVTIVLLAIVSPVKSSSSAPSLQTPENGANTSDNHPFFIWSIVTDASENYRMVISTKENFEDNVHDIWLEENADNYFYAQDQSLPDGLYYWRVRVENQPGGPTDNWSDNWWFVVGTISGRAVESWTGAVNTVASTWNVVESRTGAVSVPASTWNAVENCVGTEGTVANAWRAIENSSGNVASEGIFISGDANFTAGNGVNGGGTGTAVDPYIIENLEINAALNHGIWIRNTTKNFIIRNSVVENGGTVHYGIYIENARNGRIKNCTSENNLFGTKLVNSDNNLIDNNTVENSVYGIYLENSDNNTISSNTLDNNSVGIQPVNSDNNVISGNTIKNNAECGILINGSDNNLIDNNTVDNSPWDGIHLTSSDNNTISGNTVRNNSEYGILLEDSDNNLIFHNYLLNNSENNAHDEGTNFWDNNGEGNWWSDWQPPTYTDSDFNGVIEQPRPIEGGSNQDNYPLVIPYWRVIESWTCTASAPSSAWRTIETWTGTVGASVQWRSLETWSSTVAVPRKPHDSIYIYGDDNFTLGNGVNSGTGTAANPYTIDNWVINAVDNYGVWIRNTTKNFIIRNSVVENGGTVHYGIYIENARNGRIENCVVENSCYGIYIDNSDNGVLSNNVIENGDYGVYIYNSENWTLDNNELENNTYNFGVAGDNLADYVHDVDDSNTVNGKPVAYLVGENNITVNQDNTVGYLAIVNAENVVVENLLFENNYQGILFAYVENGLIENTIFRNNFVGVHLRHSDNDTVENNEFENNYYFGVFLAFSENNSVIKNTTSGSYYGISILSSDNNLVDNNIADNSEYGIYLSYSDNGVLSNNVIENGDYGVYIYNSENWTLDNNELENNTYNFGVAGDNLADYVHDVDDSNTVNGKPVAYLFGENNITVNQDNTVGYLAIVNAENVVVKHITIENNYQGILFAYVENCQMENNVFRNNFVGTYIVCSDNNTIENNTVENSTDYGILLSNSDSNTVSGNTVENNAWISGIYLDSSDNNTISSNALEKNLDGISISSSENNVISSNTVENNYGNGIYLSSSENIIVSNNTVRNNVSDGIYLDTADNNTISSNTAEKNSEDGIYLWYSDNNTISSNTTENNSGNGIFLWYSDSNTISNNTTENNSGNGIYLGRSNNDTVSSNTVENCSGDGIYLWHTGNSSIDSNTVDNSSDISIYLDSSDNNTISSNTVDNSHNAGVELASSDNNTISSNTVENGSEDGIYLSSSDNNTISNNTTENNSGNGIYIGSSNNNTISGNTASGNAWSGIYFDGSSGSTLTNNVCQSGNYGIYFDSSENNVLQTNTYDNSYEIPEISSVSYSNVTTSVAEITWTTEESSTSVVEYGTTVTYGSTASGGTSTGHSVSLFSLSSGTTYHYRAESTDAANNMEISADGTFTTSTPPTPPADFSIVLDTSSGSIQQGSSVSVTVSFAPSNGYGYAVSLSASGAPSGVSIGFSPGSGTPTFSAIMAITGSSSLTPGVYTITVKGTGANGTTHSANYVLLVSQQALSPPSSSVDELSSWQTSVPFTVTATASDSDGSVTSVNLYHRYSSNGSSWGSWALFGSDTASPWSWSFTAENNGYYQFYSTAKDNDNNEEYATMLTDAQCGVDTVAPSITLFKINSDNSSTSLPDVALTIAAQDATSGLDAMRFSSDGTTWSSWETFSTSKSYSLQGTAGSKTVYAAVRDKAELTVTASDSITLENVTWSESIQEIAPNENGSVDLTAYDIPATRITIVANGTLSNVMVNVGVLSERPANIPAPTMIVAKYLEIETSALSENISRAVIEFKLEKSWIEANNIDENTVQLMRYKNGWQYLSTQKTGEDSDYVYYSAETPGFSVFAIGGSAQMPTAPMVTIPPLWLLAVTGLGLLVVVVSVVWVYLRKGGKSVEGIQKPPKERPREPQEPKEPPKDEEKPQESPKEPKAPAPHQQPKPKDGLDW